MRSLLLKKSPLFLCLLPNLFVPKPLFALQFLFGPQLLFVLSRRLHFYRPCEKIRSSWVLSLVARLQFSVHFGNPLYRLPVIERRGKSRLLNRYVNGVHLLRNLLPKHKRVDEGRPHVLAKVRGVVAHPRNLDFLCLARGRRSQNLLKAEVLDVLRVSEKGRRRQNQGLASSSREVKRLRDLLSEPTPTAQMLDFDMELQAMRKKEPFGVAADRAKVHVLKNNNPKSHDRLIFPFAFPLR
jgi:hypothetical protein